MTGRLRVAGIGAGYFSRFHYDAWRAIDRAELVAVADRNLTAAQGVGVAAYDDSSTMLQQQAPDLVDIITPPTAHLELIEQALDAGIRTIICQKPFCDTLQNAEQATARAAEAGARLIVHENFRFQPWYRSIRAEMKAGRIGAPLRLTFRLRPGDGQGDDAYLSRQPYFQQMPRFLIHETGVHWVDTFRFLFGDPDAVYADLCRLNPAIAGEDAGYFVFGYADGRRALFDGNRLLDHAAKDLRRTMGDCRIEGTEGEMNLDGEGVLTFRQAGATVWEQIGSWPERCGFGGDCVQALQAHVVSAVLDSSDLENDAASYLSNMHLESALYQSAEQGAKIEVSHGFSR